MRHHTLARMVATVAALLVLQTTAHAEVDAAGRTHVFTPLPETAAGVPLAIANDGAVLVQTQDPVTLRYKGAIYNNGETELLSFAYNTFVSDFNSSHAVVGSLMEGDACVPLTDCSTGFVFDRSGTLTDLGEVVEPQGINDRGDMVGFLNYVLSGAPFVATASGRRVSDMFQPLYAFPFRINNAGHILARVANVQQFVLWDGKGVTLLALPSEIDFMHAHFTDLNDRGDLVGWWSEPPSPAPDSFLCSSFDDWGCVAHGFLRGRDGGFVPIDWSYPWPETLVRHIPFYDPIPIEVHLVRSLGTRLYGVNDLGELAADSRAVYEGVREDGSTVTHIEFIGGIGALR